MDPVSLTPPTNSDADNRLIVYIIGSLSRPNYPEQLFIRKINWLAEHTDYRIHVVLTEREKLPYPLSPKVEVTNFGLDYHKLKRLPIPERWIARRTLQQKYEKMLQLLLQDLSPTIILSLLQEEATFLYRIKCKGYKIGEIHLDLNLCPVPGKGYVQSLIRTLIFRRRRTLAVNKLKGMDNFVLDTHDARRIWAKHFPESIVIPNPLTTLPVKSSRESKKVITIGHYSAGGPLARIIIGWQRIASKYPEWRLRLFGDGDPTPCRTLVKQHKLSRSVYCNPMEENLKNRIQESAILVQTESNEHIGRWVREAMSRGIPCIAASTLHEMGELIDNETDGLLSNSYGTEDLISKLGVLIRNAELREQMGDAAYEKMQLHYNLDTVMNHWTHLFDGIVKKGE